MINLYRQATKNGLKISDLYKNLPCNSSEQLGDDLEKNWEAEILKKKPRLLRAILKSFFWGYMVHGALLFVQHVGLR